MAFVWHADNGQGIRLCKTEPGITKRVTMEYGRVTCKICKAMRARKERKW